MEEKVKPFVNQQMFCPNCRERVAPKQCEVLREEVHRKAKEIAQTKDLKEIIKQKDYDFLYFLSKFKKLEEGCKVCPKCGWSPFENLIADSVLRRYIKEHEEEIKQVKGGYLLDLLFSADASAPKRTIQELLKNTLPSPSNKIRRPGPTHK